MHMVVSYISQTVALPVRMEEHVIVPLPMLTVTVPVGTQDPTARTEVGTVYAHLGPCLQQLVYFTFMQCTYVHNCSL